MVSFKLKVISFNIWFGLQSEVKSMEMSIQCTQYKDLDFGNMNKIRDRSSMRANTGKTEQGGGVKVSHKEKNIVDC